jgi:hypothetical protein
MTFTKEKALELAEKAIKNSISERPYLIKGTANYDDDPTIKCEVLIANNNHEDINSENLFSDCNVRFNFYKESTCLFEAHSENIHPNFPHAHIGSERIVIPLNSIIVSSILESTTDLIKDSYHNQENI